MTIIYDQWKPYVSQVRYVSAGQDYDPRKASGMFDPLEAHWRLAGMVENRFGPAGGTVEEIYEELMGPKGLSSRNTREMVFSAVKTGYLRRV